MSEQQPGQIHEKKPVGPLKVIALGFLVLITWPIAIPVLGLRYFWKHSKLSGPEKKVLSGVMVCAYIFVLILVFGNIEPTPEQLAATEQQRVEAEAQKKVRDAEATERENQEKRNNAVNALKKEVSSFDAPFDTSPYRGDVVNLQLEVALFGAWAKLVNEYKSHDDPEIHGLAVELEKKASQLQSSEFPAMRKAYGELVGKKLWENNIEVKVSGTGNKTLEFTGGIFANNKNIAQTQAMVQEPVSMFRFTRIHYRWYSYDNGYYYDLDVPADSAPVNL